MTDLPDLTEAEAITLERFRLRGLRPGCCVAGWPAGDLASLAALRAKRLLLVGAHGTCVVTRRAFLALARWKARAV